MKVKTLTQELYRNNRLRFFGVIFFSTASDILALFVSVILRDITDIIAGGKGLDALKTVAWETLGILGGVIVFGAIYGLLKGKFLATAMKNYKNRVFKEITEKGISSFKGESSAKYISALTNDAGSIESNYVMGYVEILSQCVNFLGALVLMIMASPLLTLITIGLLALPILVSVLTGQKIVKYEKLVSDYNATFMESVSECLRGFSVVKSFKAEKEVRDIVKKTNDELENTKCKKSVISSILSLIGSMSGAATQFGLFLIGALLAVKSGNITAGVLLLFVNLMNNLLAPISSLPQAIASWKGAKALIEKMVTNLNEDVEEGTLEIGRECTDGITLNNVKFSYEEGKEVLHGIDFKFENGKSYALVGGSGSGKSTILNLLMSGYDNYEGSILVDGKEIRNIKDESLYECISMIEQNVFVFNNTINDNITMFRDFAKEKIDAAIEMSGLSNLIKEKGTDYVCGENGGNLSGGEKQRISIARSLLRGNSVLLVDEATAALDAETAFHVTNAILDLKDKTKIVVTHDLDEATLKRYDVILTLKDGSLVETGTFDELMNKKDYFYSLFTIAQ